MHCFRVGVLHEACGLDPLPAWCHASWLTVHYILFTSYVEQHSTWVLKTRALSVLSFFVLYPGTHHFGRPGFSVYTTHTSPPYLQFCPMQFFEDFGWTFHIYAYALVVLISFKPKHIPGNFSVL